MWSALLRVGWLVVTIALLGVGALAAFAFLSRGTTSPALQIAPGLVAEKGRGAWLYAARLGRSVVLFDAGVDPNGHPVDVALSALGASRADVTDVFLTHGHVDQSAGAASLPRATIHAGAADVDPSTGRQRPEQGLQRVLDLFIPRPTWRVGDPIAGEREIPVRGDGTVLALPVPGHSPGSTAYLANGVLYVGEIVSYRDGKLVPGPRILDADPTQSERSVARLAQRLANLPVSRICTSRGRCTPDGTAKGLLQAFAVTVAR